MVRSAVKSSGLDISLLGVIVAGIGLTMDRLGSSSDTMPHLIRFFDVPPGRAHPAILPQDAALLLLTDPATTSSGTISGAPPIIQLGDVPLIVAYLGVALVIVGPLWSWYFR